MIKGDLNMSEDCPRKIQVGSDRWTEADQELEDWLQAHGFKYTLCVDCRQRAKSEDEWQQYVKDVKAYALKCKSWREFTHIREHVKSLIPTAPSHDIRDENGKLRVIID